MRITISGSPVPKARARVVNGHAYTPAATLAYARRVTWAARETLAEYEPMARLSLWKAPLKITCWFYMPNKRRADLDNLQKAIFDACNGVVFNDDTQIVEAHAYKCVDRKNPRAVVEITIAEKD